MDRGIPLLLSNVSSKPWFYGTNNHINARLRRARLSYSGRLCDYCDFKGCKKDELCGDIIDSLDMHQSDANGEVGIFHG